MGLLFLVGNETLSNVFPATGRLDLGLIGTRKADTLDKPHHVLSVALHENGNQLHGSDHFLFRDFSSKEKER